MSFSVVTQPSKFQFLSKTLPRIATGLELHFYHSINRVSIDLKNSLPGGTEVTSNNISVRVLIADKNASSENDGYITIAAPSKYVDNGALHMDFCKTSKKENSLDIEHDFVDKREYVAKIEVDHAGVKQNSHFTFTYHETHPSFEPFEITQAPGSTDFAVSGLVMDNLPDGLLPSFMSLAFDEIDLSPDKNLEGVTAVANLYMSTDGSGAVINNDSKTSELLPNSGDVNNNNGYYTVLTSDIADLAAKKNTGYFVSASAVLSDGYAHSFHSTLSKKVFNLEPVVITHVGPNDATTSDESASTQQLMSVIINTVSNGQPLWGVYTPSTVTFTLSGDNGSVFSCVKPYLNTEPNDVNPAYTILVIDMNPQVSGTSLKNGVDYSLEVKVNWVDNSASAMSATSRSSVWSHNVVFSQGIEPLIDLTLYNAWVAIAKDNPELITENVPNLAIIASVRKTSQFNSEIGTDNLDVPGTTFKLQVKIGETGVWTDVEQASYAQVATISGGVNANIRNAANAAVFSTPLVNLSDGKIGLPPTLGGVGTSQPPVYIYIPYNLNYPFPTSSNTPVYFRASIYAGPDNSSYTPPFSTPTTSSIYMQAKPDVYTHDRNGEPVVDVIAPFTSTSTVPVNNNGVLTTLLDKDIVADSNFAMITKTTEGWLIKADGTTITKYPGYTGAQPLNKVNLYYYNKTTSGVSIKVADVNQGVGLYTLFDFNEGATNYPFINAYTEFIPGGAVGTVNKASWYNEAYVWVVNVPTLPSDQSVYGRTLIYTGSTPPSPLPPGVEPWRCLKASLSTVNPRYFPLVDPRARTPIFLAAVSTDSGAPQKVNFNMAAAGISGPDYNWIVNFGLTYSAGVTSVGDDPNLIGVKLTHVNAITGVHGRSAMYTKYNYADLVSSPLKLVGLAGNSNSYQVQKVYRDVNTPGSFVVGQSSPVYTYNHNGIPTVEDFTVTPLSVNPPGTTLLNNVGYTSYNSNGASTISFNLDLDNARDYIRIDGVQLFFESSESNISKTKIAVLRTSGDQNLPLLGPSGLVSSIGLNWNDYTSGTVTFTAFRDARAISATAEDVLASNSSISNEPVYNIPVIPRPSVDGEVLLSGGIICNSSTLYTTSLNWTRDASPRFGYKVTLTNLTANGSPITMINNSSLNSAVLSVDDASIYTYRATIEKTFFNQASVSENIEFSTAIVNTSGMVVNVLPPSSNTSLTVSWVSYTSQSGNAPGQVVPQSPANIIYMALVDTSNSPYVRINPNGSAVESTSGTYSITQYNLGTVLNLGVAVRATVNYFLNGNSSPLQSVYTALNMTPTITKYTVSTVPNVSLSSATSTVLIQGSSDPSLLLNLDARGLEVEGFISLVVILTQDGTPINPGGNEVILQFPSNPTSSNPFSFVNIVGGPGSGNANLVGGKSVSVAPLTIAPTGLSNQSGNYTLKIGSVNASGANAGRYSLSSLTFPPQNISGFVNGQTANIMAILTHRRGTDIMVGEFTYAVPPVASNVNVITTNGQYYLTFDLK